MFLSFTYYCLEFCSEFSLLSSAAYVLCACLLLSVRISVLYNSSCCSVGGAEWHAIAGTELAWSKRTCVWRVSDLQATVFVFCILCSCLGVSPTCSLPVMRCAGNRKMRLLNFWEYHFLPLPGTCSFMNLPVSILVPFLPHTITLCLYCCNFSPLFSVLPHFSSLSVPFCSTHMLFSAFLRCVWCLTLRCAPA